MKKLLFLLVALFSTTTFFAQQKINAEKSEVTFSVLNMGVNVEGTITGMEGKVNFDPYDVEKASFDVTIDPSTVDTGTGMRDKHLNNKKNLLYTKIFPTIDFVSKKVTESEDGRSYQVVGDLTIKETTKEVEIPFKFSEQEDGSVKLVGSIEILRLDYGVGGNNTTMIGEEVAVKIVCFID